MKMKKRHSQLRCALLWLKSWRVARNCSVGKVQLSHFIDGINGRLPSRSTILAACDEVYYWKFATAFLDSVQRTGGSDRIHLHLYWPSQEVIDDLERRAAGTAVTWTFQDARPEEFMRFPIIYMAAARFIIAHLIVERGHPVFVIDIDAIANRPIWPVVEAVNTGDVGMYFRPRTRKLWLRVLASGVIINPTEAGRRFADVLARTILMSLASRPDYHVDQIQLYYTSKLCRAQYFQVPHALSDFDFGPDAVIWTAKGSERKRRSEFVNAQSKASAPT